MSQANPTIAENRSDTNNLYLRNHSAGKPMYRGHPDGEVMQIVAEWHMVRDKIKLYHSEQDLVFITLQKPGLTEKVDLMELHRRLDVLQAEVLHYEPATINGAHAMLKMCVEIQFEREKGGTSLGTGPLLGILCQVQRGLSESVWWDDIPGEES